MREKKRAAEGGNRIGLLWRRAVRGRQREHRASKRASYASCYRYVSNTYSCAAVRTFFLPVFRRPLCTYSRRLRRRFISRVSPPICASQSLASAGHCAPLRASAFSVHFVFNMFAPFAALGDGNVCFSAREASAFAASSIGTCKRRTMDAFLLPLSAIQHRQTS